MAANAEVDTPAKLHVTEQEFEPHLRVTVGSYLDTWHRFEPPTKEKFGVVLHTKCGKDIHDHWNTRTRYNPRIDRFCSRCFPNGVTSEGRPKSSKGNSGTRKPAANAAGDAPASNQERAESKGGQPLTSTPEPLVSETPDGGDGGTTPEEGSRIQRSGDDGHVEELPEGGRTGDSNVEGSTSKEAGQGKQVHEPSKGSKERSTSGRKSEGHSS